MRPAIATLLAMAVLALAAGAGIAAGAANGMAGSGVSNLTLALASEDDDARLNQIMPLLQQMKEVQNYANLLQTTPQTAREMVQNGNAAAAIILPAGFLNSLASGQNLAPVLVVNGARPLETLLVGTLAQSVVGMLVSAQQGIALTLAAAGPQNPAVITEINLEYAYWVLGRGHMYRTQTVYATGQFTVWQHYMATSLLFFALLCAPVLYPLFSLRRAKGWVGRLRAAGCSLPAYATANMLAGGLACLVPLVVLPVGIVCIGGAVPTVGSLAFLLAAVVLGAVLAACFGFVCCNAGGLAAAGLLVFLTSAAGLFAAGGILPPVLLPRPIAVVGNATPIGLMRQAVGPLFGLPAQPVALLGLAGWALLFYIGGLLLAKKRGAAL